MNGFDADGRLAKAALNGGNEYATRINQHLLGILYLPQTVSDVGGELAGYIVNLTDSNTRSATLADTVLVIQANVASLVSTQDWQKYGEYLLTPTGIADIVAMVDGTLAGGLKPSPAKPQIVAPAAKKSLVDQTVIADLQASGVKITPQNVVATSQNAAGQTVFLEVGNSASGLTHIVQAHGDDFARIGVSQADIPSVVTKAVTEGTLVGYQGAGTGRPIYQVTVNGQTQTIAVTVGDNGYIVGANPAGAP